MLPGRKGPAAGENYLRGGGRKIWGVRECGKDRGVGGTDRGGGIIQNNGRTSMKYTRRKHLKKISLRWEKNEARWRGKNEKGRYLVEGGKTKIQEWDAQKRIGVGER